MLKNGETRLDFPTLHMKKLIFSTSLQYLHTTTLRKQSAVNRTCTSSMSSISSSLFFNLSEVVVIVDCLNPAEISKRKICVKI